MSKGHFSGTVAASNMSHHGGKVKGAGELGGNYGSPGKAAMKVKTKMSGLPYDGVASGKRPKGMKTYNQE